TSGPWDGQEVFGTEIFRTKAKPAAARGSAAGKKRGRPVKAMPPPLRDTRHRGRTDPRDIGKEIAMPLFLDIHRHVPGLTAEGAAQAHARDLAVQDARGVNYRKYWFDDSTGQVFCLVDAPSREAAEAVHREAHGLVADELVEVEEGS